MRKATICVLVTLALTSHVALAGDVDVQKDGTVSWQAGVDGVGLDCNPDGSFKRLYARADHYVNFPDRAGISKAQTIAEEEAKAHITAFIRQQLASGVMEKQIDEDLSKSSRNVKDGSETISKDTTRTIVENVTKMSSSASQGTLSGVIVLERGYDDKKENAWTVVGVSQKSIAVAHGLAAALNGQQTAVGPQLMDSQAGTNSGNAGNFLHQPSEVRQSKTDW
jgi:hypothetical protein